MKRQITIYLALTLLVFGLGYVGFSTLQTDSQKAIPKPAAEQPLPKEPEPAQPKAQSLLVKKVNGVVERSGVSGDNWTKVFPGNALFADQKLRTDKNASVRLQTDDNSKIELEGRSEISIQEINETVHKFKLELGRLNVDYRNSKNRKLKISSDSNSGEAETSQAQFIIQKADGKLSVATQEGEVALSADGKDVVVGAGKLSYVLEGEAPSRPEPIPLNVMLRVANPSKRKQAEWTTTIRGRTDATARVHVNDTPALVDRTGRFQVTIPLEQGRNPINVKATTAYGSAEKQLPSILVTNSVYTNVKPPAVDSAEVRWGKRKKQRKTRPSHESQKTKKQP